MKARTKAASGVQLQLAPAVEEVLTGAGFTVEGRLPLMTCTRTIPSRSPSELIVPVSDAELLATVTVQNEAYGDSASQDGQRLTIPWWQVELHLLV